MSTVEIPVCTVEIPMSILVGTLWMIQHRVVTLGDPFVGIFV